MSNPSTPRPLFLTNEYPPHVYGGAGVHVDFLTRELSKLTEVTVRSFGDQDIDQQGLRVQGIPSERDSFSCPAQLSNSFDAALRSIRMNSLGVEADLVHCHTWYTHLGGIIAKLNYGIPLVITVHSLEPLRPWKREQLGGGYEFSSWVERTALEMADAVIAVSSGTRDDILRHFQIPADKIHVIFNGIDTDFYHPTSETSALLANGIDPEKPYLLFVGRITRQKGITYLANAIRYLDPGFQVVLCAGAPDTPEIAAEMESAVAAVKDRPDGVIWIDRMLDSNSMVQIYSNASVFCCPSIYEPFGIINLEAMACKVPVVASAVGGIPEVVLHHQTGTLVPVAQETFSPFAPRDPDIFSRDLAAGINELMANPEKRRQFGEAGRARAITRFSWKRIANETLDLYRTLCS
ncbi:MAG: glycogen synthase [Puniceicoccaceae bacterium]